MNEQQPREPKSPSTPVWGRPRPVRDGERPAPASYADAVRGTDEDEAADRALYEAMYGKPTDADSGDESE